MLKISNKLKKWNILSKTFLSVQKNLNSRKRDFREKKLKTKKIEN